jgi:hypothetical protein
VNNHSPVKKKSKTRRNLQKAINWNKYISNSGKVLLGNRSGSDNGELLRKCPQMKNLENNDNLENNENKEFNNQITEKDVNEKVIDNSRKILGLSKYRRNKTKRKKTKRKTYNNSYQILKKFDSQFNSIQEEKDKKNIVNVNNVNININNINSMKDNNGNTKDSKEILLEGKKKKSLISYFKGDNFSDFELNELSYTLACEHDKRSFFYFYWQLIRREHLIVFTFFSWDDYNILSIKLSKFMFAVALDFAVNVVFFVDDTMHKIYVDYGKYNFIAQIPQILYSTVASEALDVFLRYLCIIEKDIYKIKQIEKKADKLAAKQEIFKLLNCIRLKLAGYFFVTFLFMCFFWYYISSFCAVYKNTQVHLIKDSMVSLFCSLLYPFGLYLLPTALRKIALSDKQKRLGCLYKLSDIIPLI